MGYRDRDENDGALGGCIIIICLIVFIVYCIIVASIYILAFTGLCGIFWGICKSTYNFIVISLQNLFKRSGKIEEDLYISYFHLKGDCFKNLPIVCKKTFEKNIIDAKWPTSGAPEKWFLKIFYYAFRIFLSVTMVLSSIIYLPILLSAFSIVFFLIWIFFTALTLELRLFEWIVIKIHGLFNICKHCHQKIDLPIYICPGCGTEHSKLLSSVKYGTFFTRCKCGEYLPTSRFFGRNTLASKCPHKNCGNLLQSQDVVPVSIAIIGGQAVGKTHFMMDSLYLLKNDVLPKMKRSILIPKDDEANINRILQQYESGIDPQATKDAMIEAVCLEMKEMSWSFPQRLYLYDPPGESFTDSKKVSSHKYYSNMKAAVLVIDPFTLASVRRDYEKYRLDSTLQSKTNTKVISQDVFERWLISMDRDFKGVVKDAICAVVINKTDEPSFTKITGLNAASTHDTCRDFLHRYDCDNFVRQIEQSFKKTEFFAVSSVGKGGNGQHFDPQGISRVLSWILYNI